MMQPPISCTNPEDPEQARPSDRYEAIGSLEYANAYEKIYGVTDEAFRYYTVLQNQLARFDTKPRFSTAMRKRLAGMENRVRDRDRATCDPIAEIAELAYSAVRLEGTDVPEERVSELAGLRYRGGDAAAAAANMAELEAADAVCAACEALTKPDKALSVETVCRLHAYAAAHLPDITPGEIRWEQVYLNGSGIVPPPPGRVGALLEDAIGWYNEQPGIERAIGFHLLFEDIHPFMDGNGRTGRVLLGMMLSALGYPPVALPCRDADRTAYLEAIHTFAADTIGRNADPMADIVCRAVERRTSPKSAG